MHCVPAESPGLLRIFGFQGIRVDAGVLDGQAPDIQIIAYAGNHIELDIQWLTISHRVFIKRK